MSSTNTPTPAPSAPKAVLVFGASSAIGRAVAAELADRGYPLYLASRQEDDLHRIALDLKIRYEVDVNYAPFDAENFASHRAYITHANQVMKGFEGVVVAFGDLGDHETAIKNFDEAKQIIDINFLGACSVLSVAANHLEKQRSGFIVGITSVAGDRGRQSNYIYGAAKGALTIFLSGLRNRLYHSKVHVLTVKPGFVDTAMTFGKEKMFLVETPEYVGEAIVKALEKKKDEIYVPWFWRPIMFMIRNIPESLFKRLKL